MSETFFICSYLTARFDTQIHPIRYSFFDCEVKQLGLIFNNETLNSRGHDVPSNIVACLLHSADWLNCVMLKRKFGPYNHYVPCSFVFLRQRLKVEMSSLSAASVEASPAIEGGEQKKPLKPCCACPETKKARDAW